MARKPGSASKIVGVTPKLYIKDDGTDYISGEEFNGLWSTNSGTTDFSYTTATGYANAGHWKFNEIEGNTAFNLRHRGSNNLLLRKMLRGKDGIGTFVQYQLADNLPLSSASPEMYCMVGTGEGFVETTDFANFVQSGPVNAHNNLASGNLFNGKLFFDMWGFFRKMTTQQTQVLLYMHNHGDSDNYDRVLIFEVQHNSSGLPDVRFKFLNNAGTGLANAISTEAGTALYPKGVTEDGGFHHIAVVFDRETVAGGGFNSGSGGIYVDGVKMAVSSTSGTFMNSAQSVNTNAFIGCRIEDSNGTWTATQGSGDPKFDRHFTGKIYMAQLSSDATAATAARIANIHGQRFDIPRGPQKVDFSDRFEVDGPNVLQDIGSLKQQMETLKGSFTVTLSSVKVKN